MRPVSRLFAILLTATIGLARILAAPENGDDAEFRAVTVQVLDLRGKPAVGVKVFLRGLERDAMGMNQDFEAPPGGWRFVTDSRGRFNARFGMFHSIEHEEQAREFLPGWGTFYFVAFQSGTAGAVSPRIENYSWKAGEGGSLPRDRDEWSRGRTIRLLKPTARVSMWFKKGLDVSGRVVNPKGKPLKGVEFSLTHDLHVWSHTGYGGEIFVKDAFSDRSGHFAFHHVYPVRFDLQMAPDQDLFWEKTKIRRKSSSEIVDEIAPHPGVKSISVVIVASRHVRFRYFGRIADASGHPVPGAKVAIGISTHRIPKTFGDEHHFLDAVADQDGKYEISATSPYARFMRVSARGFQDGVRDFDRGPVAPPGRYDFSLSMAEASEAKK